ncbi:MAG: ATP-binding protein [Cytophagaceae bacterium]
MRDSGKINILLVDDKKQNLLSLESLLEDVEQNVHFISVTSGEEALKVAISEEIALILLDVQMPGMGGYEVVATLKKSIKTRNIPVIFVTALNYDTSYIEKGYEFGAVDYLFKPLNPVITKSKVNAFIQMYLHRKELEQKNIELQNLGLLVKNTKDYMCILTENDLSFIALNPSFLSKTQLVSHQLYDKPADLTGLFSPELLRLLREAEKKRAGNILFEDKITAGSNEQIWVSWSFVLENGKWYGNGRDVSEKKKAEDALNTAYLELEQKVKDRTSELVKINAELKNEIDKRSRVEQELKLYNEKLIKTNEELDNFVYTASHDLKLPIANMEGLVNTLAEELELTGELSTIMEMLNHSVVQLKTTVQDLLNIIQIQKKGKTDVELLDCQSIIDEIKFSIKDLIQESGVEIIEELDCNEVKLNKADLKSILYNLISNSIKYRSPLRNPFVRIFIRSTEEHTIISIIDNGLGIPEENQNKIFQMFKRAHDHVEGSGIGLYIVKRTVEKYGGFIEVISQENKGTEFKIYFNK